MARFRDLDMAPKFVPVDFIAQMVPGTFAHAMFHLVDELDLSPFDARYKNDLTGAPAHSPAMLLRAVLLGYSQGLVSSRSIESACLHNVLFMAVTADAKPHFTTIASFVSRSYAEIKLVFGQVLAILDREGLIAKDMFAIDGVKLPSNASKSRSGSVSRLARRAERMEAQVEKMLNRHRENDDQSSIEDVEAKGRARIERMAKDAKAIRDFLGANPKDKKGKKGGVRQSNLTDNESGLLKTDKGVIQGYCGIAVVDAAHQVIVAAEAFGTGAEQELLGEALKACEGLRTKETLVTADSGFHSADNLAEVANQGINALIADPDMRRRQDAQQGIDSSIAKRSRNKGLFEARDFVIAEDGSHAICPAGKHMHRNGETCGAGASVATRYRASTASCNECPLRTQCLRQPQKRYARQIAILRPSGATNHLAIMREKIDSEEGRKQYSRRIGTVEPVFANIRHNKRMDRFTLRGRNKVDGQWKLFALVHNIEKLGKFRSAA